MTNEILEKLRAHLDRGLPREADVVYLFVQARKLMESLKLQRDFPTLTFYCNWVMHTRLDRVDRNPAMKRMLEGIDNAVAGVEGRPDVMTDEAILSDVLSVSALRDDLGALLSNWPGMVDLLTADTERWQKVVYLLTGILVDLPLVAPPDARAITEFRFTVTTNGQRRVKVTAKSGQVIERDV